MIGAAGAAAVTAHHIAVASPSMLYVHTRLVMEEYLLVVYRSVAVRVNGLLYKPVRDFLNEHWYTRVSEVEVEDPEMVGRAAVETMYAIHGRKEELSPLSLTCA